MAGRKHGEVYIYALCDPSDGAARFIGKSKDPKVRFYHHLKEKGPSQKSKCDWVQDLLKRNEKPEMVILDHCPASLGRLVERYWITKALLDDQPLLNNLREQTRKDPKWEHASIRMELSRKRDLQFYEARANDLLFSEQVAT